MTHIIIHIASFTRFIIKFFPKIMENKFTAGNRSFSKSHDILKQCQTNLLFRHRLTTHKLFEFFDVFVTVERQTMSLTAISTRSSRLLVITFYTLGHVIMNHKANVWFIDPHTKGNRCDDNISIFHKEHILIFNPCLRVQACMIRDRTYPINLKGLC